MSKSKVDQTNARLRRGEEMRLGLILAALKASAPRKLAKVRKGAGETRPADQPEPAVA
jgi:hypothetical protein